MRLAVWLINTSHIDHRTSHMIWSTTVFRALSIYLPNWAIDLQTRRDRKRSGSRLDISPPLLLVRPVANRQVIAHACRTAAAAGVQPGMTVAHAHALLRDEPRIVEYNPPRDAAALRALAEWAVRFSPIVAPDPPDGLLIDVTGSERLFRGERRLIQRVGRSLNRLGFDCRLAIGPTCGAAWAVAHFGRPRATIISDNRLVETLKPLPVHALRIDGDIASALAEVNVDRIEHLLALPRHDLAERYGSKLLLRLDQALGHAFEPIDPVRPAEPLTVTFEFDGPAKQFEAIVEATRRLLQTLCERLAQREAGAGAIHLVYEQPDRTTQAFDVTLGRPTRQVCHLWLLTRPRLDQIDIGHGFDSIAMTAHRVTHLPHHQVTHWSEDHTTDRHRAEQFAQLLDVMMNRLGGDRIWRLRPGESHDPRRVYAFRPADEPIARTERLAMITQADRPSVLFDRPEPVEVTVVGPDDLPQRLCWHGHEYEIITALGPERIGERWWVEDSDEETKRQREGVGVCRTSSLHLSISPSLTHTDLFKTQFADGRWFWLSRTHAAVGFRWAIEGQWR